MLKVIILIASVIFILILIIANRVTNLLIHPKVRDEQTIYEREIRLNRFPVTFFELVKKHEISIQSRYGYQLSCLILENEITKRVENKKKIAVFCHGYKCSKTSAIVYAKIFMEFGYTAILYDHRNHGQSDRNFTSMGFYEKHDLDTVIQYCYNTYGRDIQLVLHGESMGAATVLSYLTMNANVAAVVADCGYSDLTQLVKHQIRMYTHFPALFVLPVVNHMLKLRAGFTLKEVSPIQGALDSKTPILFIHGNNDSYVPYQMSIDMYEQRRGEKELYLAKDATHAQAYVVDQEQYQIKIKEFLVKYELA